MILSLNTWHARWFKFVQSKIGSYHRYEQGTTLCHYMRVCLVWGPLLIAFWGAIASVICMLLYAAEAQGWRSAIKLGLPPWFGLLFFPAGLAAFAFTAALAVLLVLGVREFFRWLSRVPQTVQNSDNFAVLGIKYVASIKGKYCPIIQFVTPVPPGQIGNPD